MSLNSFGVYMTCLISVWSWVLVSPSVLTINKRVTVIQNQKFHPPQLSETVEKPSIPPSSESPPNCSSETNSAKIIKIHWIYFLFLLKYINCRNRFSLILVFVLFLGCKTYHWANNLYLQVIHLYIWKPIQNSSLHIRADFSNGPDTFLPTESFKIFCVGWFGGTDKTCRSISFKVYSDAPLSIDCSSCLRVALHPLFILTNKLCRSQFISLLGECIFMEQLRS